MSNRWWFDQVLGDENLHAVHDGNYGLIAGKSAEQYRQLPDNDDVETHTYVCIILFIHVEYSLELNRWTVYE